MRDSQRAKVYKAEHIAFDANKEACERLESVHEISRWVNGWLLKLKRVRDIEVPADVRHNIKAYSWFARYGERKVDVQDGAGCRRALAFNGAYKIEMPKWARKKWVIVHEVAHLLSPHCVHHQWQYAYVYLKLTLYAFGAEAEKTLKAAFKLCRVKYNPPRAKQPMSAERKAALSARLTLARAAKSRPTAAAVPAVGWHEIKLDGLGH